MAVTLEADELAAAIRVTSAVATRLLPVVAQVVEDYAPDAPEPLQDEAAIRLAGYLKDSGTGAAVSRGVDTLNITYVTNHATMFRNSGAAALLTRYRVRRGGKV